MIHPMSSGYKFRLHWPRSNYSSTTTRCYHPRACRVPCFAAVLALSRTSAAETAPPHTHTPSTTPDQLKMQNINRHPLTSRVSLRFVTFSLRPLSVPRHTMPPPSSTSITSTDSAKVSLFDGHQGTKGRICVQGDEIPYPPQASLRDRDWAPQGTLAQLERVQTMCHRRVRHALSIGADWLGDTRTGAP